MLATPLLQTTHAEELTFERGLMGTRFAITCHSSDPEMAKQAAEAAFDEAERINQVASDYIADSELLAISKHPAGTPVTVSPLLFRLLSEARDLAEKSGGSFDPTLGPLTRLWRESRRRNHLPDPATLENARSATGWRNLALNSGNLTVTFSKPSMRLDLGGIAKGQSADAMLVVMKNHGIPRTCITAGGDIRLGDPPPDSSGWKIGVRTFDNDHDTRILELANCAVSTSGDLHQSITIDGTRYSHIIDPATGLGLTREVAATVVAPTATLSDALATACCAAAGGKARAMAIAAGATHVYLEEPTN
ncbi:MAG: FAD:protein FMN transferase [Luteolibacter sp.]|uniref:FAD:protein FMN transferase n=1 Tax=Luteolibacter sp. TaxID=1962973 RepID=UPI003265982F